LLKQGLGLSMTAKDGLQHKAADHKIDILSVNSWTMHAQVAESFANSHNNVFLVGDAAHRFPPAG
jgi:2-polyprenyl-6-methoxyphenol hydroxylase-like FAD-dependent oxidoreductase